MVEPKKILDDDELAGLNGAIAELALWLAEGAEYGDQDHSARRLRRKRLRSLELLKIAVEDVSAVGRPGPDRGHN